MKSELLSLREEEGDIKILNGDLTNDLGSVKLEPKKRLENMVKRDHFNVDGATKSKIERTE